MSTEMSTETKPDNTSELGRQLAQNMPDVTVKTPPAKEGDATPPQTPAFAPDSLGRPWDASKHRVNADGTPRLDTKGRFVSLNLGRKRQAGVSAPASHLPSEAEIAVKLNAQTETPVSDAETPPPGESPNAQPAEVISRTVYLAAGAVTGHPEEATPTPGEHKNIKAATTAALDHVGFRPHPFLLFSLAYIGYVVATAAKPKTRKTLAECWRKWRERPAGKAEPLPKTVQGAQNAKKEAATGAQTAATPPPPPEGISVFE
jgi:hypothetical protein